MALRITIDVFSGRPNPVVTIGGLEERELLERLAGTSRGARGDKTRAARRAPKLPPATLGYRGVVVERLDEGKAKGVRSPLPSKFRVAAGFLFGGRTGVPVRDPGVEDFVCGPQGPFRGLLEREFFDICPREILRYRDLLVRWPWKVRPWPTKHSCACAPLWEPEWWNDGGQRQGNNNCYNYGTNYRTDTYAQPGKANGNQYSSITCAEVKAGAVSDALIDSPGANNKCPKEGHLVALVVGPGWDYHWYRKGRNGYWTHKPGWGQATELDNSNNLITDPRTADRGGYTSFCTFMVVMHGHVKIN